jgi:CheY-like chemotaxis protein
MDATLAAFIFGCAVLAVIAVLLWRSQNRDGRAHASFTFGELFTAAVTLEPKNAESAENAMQRAAQERGEPAAPPVGLITATTTKLARLLWVDDDPDNNLYETVALEQLGRFVTKATSTEAALRYLDELKFALIITDLGRDHDRRAGEELIRRVRAQGQSLPIVVYTMDAAQKRADLLALGADAVVDLPHELIHEVNARIASLPQNSRPSP